MTTSTWADTDAGVACLAIMNDTVSVLVPSYMTALPVNYGFDDWNKIDAAPLIRMKWTDACEVKPGLHTGYPYDAITPIACEVWGTDPMQAQTIWHQLMLSIDKIAHGRASVPGRWRPSGGEIGFSGAKYIGVFGISLGVFYKQRPLIKPTSAAVVGVRVGQESLDLGA